MSTVLALCALIFIAAFLYSSVGHGGASAYLAIFAFYSIPYTHASTGALILNLTVSAVAFCSFLRASYFSWELTRPFILLSIPFAFVGGFIKISPFFYSLFLGSALLLSAYRLCFLQNYDSEIPRRDFPLPLALGIGAGIGLLSGMIGIGGGVFLSPLLILLGWAGPKHAAGTASFFILVNSAAGLMGRILGNRFHLSPLLTLFVCMASLGCILGAGFGSRSFSGRWLNRILGFVLFLATLKLFQALL